MHITKGFSLLECLIALSLLAFTLLGLARLHINAFHAFSANQQYTHAAQLALDMTERIRANANGAKAGYYNRLSTQNSSASNTNCQTSACSAKNLADYDLAQWRDQFSILTSGKGIVTGNGAHFRVTVLWDSEKNGATGTTCSNNKLADLDCFTLDAFL